MFEDFKKCFTEIRYSQTNLGGNTRQVVWSSSIEEEKVLTWTS